MISNTTVQDPVEPFLATLREATAPMHAALEAGPLSTALLQEHVTTAAYAIYLHRMYDVMRFCEQLVFPLVSNIITDLPQRRKLHLIEADLAQLNFQATKTGATYRPFDTASIAFALGYLYVTEGSTLGGRVLLKHLGPKLPIDETRGGTFFAGYGKDTAAKWKLFLQQFGTYVTEQRGEREAITGAQHAFTSIAQHFDK